MEFLKKHRLISLVAASCTALLIAYAVSKFIEDDEYSARKIYSDPARQVSEDISHALSLTYQLKTYGEWQNSGFTPEEILKNARELRASQALCSSLGKLNPHDLTYFDSILRNEQQSRFLPCRTQLMSKLNHVWKEHIAELDTYVQENVAKVKLSRFSLCFHGGPDPERTGALLDLFKKAHIKASFFVLPEKAKKYPGLVRRMILEGHQVGALGWSDVGVTAYGTPNRTDVERSHREILRTQEMIVSTLGPRTSMEVHFPNIRTMAESKAVKEDLTKALRRSGLRIHPEHLESHDWKYRNPTELFQSIRQVLEQNADSSDRFPISLAFSDQFEQTLIVVEKLLEVGRPVSPPKPLDRNHRQKMALQSL